MIFIRRHIKFLFVFVLPVYLFIVQQTIQNKHTHFYPNGIVVIHSHPVNKEAGQPMNSEGHSKTEILLYASLHFDLYKTSDFTFIEFVQNGESRNFYIADERLEYTELYLETIPRGPPA